MATSKDHPPNEPTKLPIEATSAKPPTATDYASMKHSDLQKLCRKRGLDLKDITWKAGYIQLLQDDDTAETKVTETGVVVADTGGKKDKDKGKAGAKKIQMTADHLARWHVEFLGLDWT